MSDTGLTEEGIEKIFSLYRRATTDQTTTFDILDKQRDENTHAQFLKWMLDPTGSHGLGDLFLNQCIKHPSQSEYEIEEVDGTTVNSVRSFNQDPDDTELDIFIETDSRIIAFELKTQSPLRDEQICKQTRYLQNQITENDFDSWDYLLLTQENQPQHPSHPHLYWRDIHQMLSSTVGRVDSDIDALRIRDWMHAIDKDLIRQQDFGPESELALRYGDWLDKLGIPYDSEAYTDDRQRLFRRIGQWLKTQYEPSDDEWLPSRIEKEGTDIYRIGQKKWQPEDIWFAGDGGIWFEILARENRLKHGTDSGSGDSYCSTDSLIEVTLRHKISKKDAGLYPEKSTDGVMQRDRLHEKLADDGHIEQLKKADFRRTRCLLAEDLNRYHVYSREIPLFEQDGRGVFTAVQNAVEALMNTRASIDEFVKAERERET